MAEAITEVGLDPKLVLQAIGDMSKEVKELARTIEESLGKKAPQAMQKTEDQAEKSTSKISTFFRNLGNRVKSDLKSAFDITSVLGGKAIMSEIASSVKSVFELEKAFDRLNSRLNLTGKTYEDFKKKIGGAVAATGQKLEDVFPGVETAAAKGGVKSPEELAAIAGALGKVRAATGESTEALADSVVEILKTQGQKVTGDTFRQTLDALQATRATGAFKTAGEAGQAIEGISKFGKQMGLSTREMGGLAATASRGGAAGQDILRQLMEQGSQVGGMEKLNAIFGVPLFKGGKLDASQIGKINTGKFGQFSQQTMEGATGIHGAAGSDLTRFVESFKSGMGDFDKVAKGADETSKQFQTATDNLTSSLETFREEAKNATREVGEGLVESAHHLWKAAAGLDSGEAKKAGGRFLGALESVNEHKGTLAATAGLAVGGAALFGGGIKALLGGGLAGRVLGGAVGGAAAEAMGVQKVYVVNANEMGGGIGGGGTLAQLGKFGLAGAAGVAGYGLATGAIGLADKATGGGATKAITKPADWLANMLLPSKEEDMAAGERQAKAKAAGEGHDGMAQAVAKGVEIGMQRAKRGQPVQLSNPSRVSGRGAEH